MRRLAAIVVAAAIAGGLAGALVGLLLGGQASGASTQPLAGSSGSRSAASPPGCCDVR